MRQAGKVHKKGIRRGYQCADNHQGESFTWLWESPNLYFEGSYMSNMNLTRREVALSCTFDTEKSIHTAAFSRHGSLGNGIFRPDTLEASGSYCASVISQRLSRCTHTYVSMPVEEGNTRPSAP